MVLSISIIKGSITLAGLLYQPPSINNTIAANGTLPALVIVHPGGGVKEQAASLYAQRLSEQGYVTIAFDAAHQGSSGGLPQYLEDPNSRVSDAWAVLDYLETLTYVDSDRVAVVGICAGGGYAAAAATGDHRFKAAVTVSAVNIGDSNRQGWMGTDSPASQLSLVLDSIPVSISAEAKGGAPTYLNYVPTIIDSTTPVDLADAADYYLTPRAQFPTAKNIMLVRSMPLLLNFDAFQFASLYLSQPTLIVYGDLAESAWHSERLYRILSSNTSSAAAYDPSTSVQRFVIPGGRHMDFYDREPYVGPTITRISEFLEPILKK
ncbi:hypothetical protein IFR05_003341 [Cadophora sp. M221]|nr:hypothetical protein IFR05_003341 [Cadophora sp. M221]